MAKHITIVMIALLVSTLCTALSADDQEQFEREITAARRALLGLPDMRAVLLAELEQKIANDHERQLAKQKRDSYLECKKQCVRYLLMLKSHGRRIDRLYRQWLWTVQTVSF